MFLSRRQAIAIGAAAPASALLLTTAQAQTSGGRVPIGDDPLLVAPILMMGRKQIEICRFAMDRLQSDEAKSFARAEIEEHEAIKKKLKALGYEYPQPGGQRAGSDRSGTGTASGTGTGVVQARGEQPGSDFVAQPVSVGRVAFPPIASEILQIHDQVTDRCIATFKERAGKKQGRMFDKAFLGQQLHEHYSQMDHAEVFSRHASERMKPILAECRQTIERNIATLEGLMPKYDDARQDDRRDDRKENRPGGKAKDENRGDQ